MLSHVARLKMPKNGPTSPLYRTYARIASVLFIALTPLVLYFAVTRFSVRTGALIVASWVAFRLAISAISRTRAEIRHALAIPLVSLACALLGAAAESAWLLLLLPSLTQFGIASVFAASLRKTPLIEQFARMQQPELSPEEKAYCRKVTIVWSVFLSLSGCLGLLLAWFATPGVWAFFTGVGSYLLVALLFAAEYIYRQFRFPNHRFRDLKRVYRRLFPGP